MPRDGSSGVAPSCLTSVGSTAASALQLPAAAPTSWMLNDQVSIRKGQHHVLGSLGCSYLHLAICPIKSNLRRDQYSRTAGQAVHTYSFFDQKTSYVNLTQCSQLSAYLASFPPIWSWVHCIKHVLLCRCQHVRCQNRAKGRKVA